MAPEEHRTFLAVYPDKTTQAVIIDWMTSARERFPGIRWTPEHQLHFTLRFFGNLDQASLDRAARVLETNATSIRPLFFPLNGIGAFPDWRRPRILWIGTGAGADELEEAARRLDIQFAEAGLGRADKPFRAHLTVGRVREGERLERDEIEKLRREPFSTPPFSISEMHLMLSRLGKGGATHEVFRKVKLGS